MNTRFLASIFVVAAVALPVSGQTFGEITGNVADTSGAVIAGAAVTVTNTATSQTRGAVTNDAGQYVVPFLPPGVYDVTAEMPSFKQALRRGVTIQVGFAARIDFHLEVGSVSESIEVVAAAPLLDTQSNAVGTVIENKRIVELPLNGRNYLQLVRLTPYVNAEMGTGGQASGRQGGERSQQPISVAGQRLEFNRFTLDGVDNTDVNFNTFVVRPSIDALQEFKVQSGVYSAEFGRSTSQINVTTKSGANQFHGTAFWFHRNDDLDAKEWGKDGSKNPFVRNQYGFTLSGPVVVPKVLNGKNRLFFLSNLEILRDRKAILQRANVATDRMRAGDFSTSGRDIFDPLSRTFETDASGSERAVSATPFPGNVVPQSRVNPVAQRLLEFYPRATVPGDSIFNNFTRDAKRPINWEQFTQRMDFTENSSSTWFGRLSYGDEFVRDTANFEQREGKTTTKTWQAMISNTRTFSPTVVNEFRFGYTGFDNDRLLRFAFERDVTSELGIIGLESPVEAAFGTPNVGLENGLSGFGESTGGPFLNNNHTFQWLDNVSIVRGNHTIKFGGEARRERFNQLGNQFPRGSFIFQAKATFDPANRNATGHSFGDFLLGESRRSERALGLANVQFRRWSLSFYAEDTWKVTPKLTLNLGLRYERIPPFHDRRRGIMNVLMFDPGVGPDGLLEGTRAPIFVRPGEGDFHDGLLFRFHDGIETAVGDDLIGRALVQTDNTDFAPRVGVAYTPTQNWTVRAGFGVFYSQDAGNPVFDLGRNLGGRGRFESNEERPNSNLLDPWAFERAQFTCTGFDGVCQGPPFVLGNIVGRRTPYILQYMFNVQRQLTDNIVLEVGYQGNQSRKLGRLRAYNEAILRTGPEDSRSISQRQPWPQFGRIQQVDHLGNANYNALGLKLQQRFSKGLTYLVAYTWSKSIDDTSAIRTRSGDRLFPPNSYDIAAERGLSQFHQEQRVVASFVYELPLGRGKHFLSGAGVGDAILGGWQLSSIVTFADGTPLNVGNIGDRANIGGDGNFPDATGIDPIPDNRTPDNYWNIAAFDPANPELQFRFGNVGRNVLFNPGLAQWDFSAVKNTRIREGHTLQFRFEGFNFSNRPNFNAPATDSRNPATFGRITTARTMRELQFGLKYVF